MDNLQEMQEKIKGMECAIKKLRNPLVGELYIRGIPSLALYRCDPWTKIREKDILDEVDGNVKIKGYFGGVDTWVKKSRLILYHDIEKRKKTVEKRLQK